MMNMQERRCRQCGKPLAPNEEFCGNCGTHSIESSMTDLTQRASSPYQNPSNPNRPPLAPTQYAGPPAPSYGSASEQYGAPPPPPGAGYTSPSSPDRGTAYGGNAGNYGQYGPQLNFPPASGNTYNGGAGISGTSGAYGQQAVPPVIPVVPGGFSQPPQPQPQRKKGPNVPLITGIIALLLILIIGGSVFLLIQRGNSTPPVTHTTTPTPAPTHGVTPPPTPVPLFSDIFADNSKGWIVGSGAGYTLSVGNNVMIMADSNHKILFNPVPGQTFNDFSVTISFTLLQGDSNDSAGLYLRKGNGIHQGYLVEINGDNTYDIYKAVNTTNGDSYIVHPTAFSSINAEGQQNTMTVIMKGSQIVVMINNKMATTISDSNYTSGQIALFAQNSSASSGVKASFSSIAVYPAPHQLPS